MILTNFEAALCNKLNLYFLLFPEFLSATRSHLLTSPPHGKKSGSEKSPSSSPSSAASSSRSSSPSSNSDQDTNTNTDSDRPALSYVTLISMAILEHPDKRLVLGDIYQYLMDKYPHFKNSSDRAWRNSIRHNLSINECFIKVGRLDNGKGNYWAIHPACVEDFSKGDFRRRQARRRARRAQNVNVSRMSQSYK